MISLSGFLRDQGRIYEEMAEKEARLRSEGIVPSNVTEQHHRGNYLIALRHDESITGPLGEFSREVAGVVPSLVYDERNAHTSIVVHQAREDFVPDEEVIDGLRTSVDHAFADVREITPLIKFEGWRFTQDSFLAEGRAGRTFAFIAKLIYDAMAERGIQEDRTPWGGHITAGRFTERRTPEQLGDLYDLMDRGRPSLGLSDPVSIDVGYSRIEDGVHSYIVDENNRFELK